MGASANLPDLWEADVTKSNKPYSVAIKGDFGSTTPKEREEQPSAAWTCE